MDAFKDLVIECAAESRDKHADGMSLTMLKVLGECVRVVIEVCGGF